MFDYDLEALAFIDMQQGDEDRLVLDKLSAHSTKEYPATAFVQVELDGNKLSTSSIGGERSCRCGLQCHLELNWLRNQKCLTII